MYLNFKIFNPEMKKILEFLDKNLEENFFEIQFLTNNINGGLNFFIRVLEHSNKKLKMTEIDHYDYISYKNPENEDFYLN